MPQYQVTAWDPARRGAVELELESAGGDAHLAVRRGDGDPELELVLDRRGLRELAIAVLELLAF